MALYQKTINDKQVAINLHGRDEFRVELGDGHRLFQFRTGDLDAIIEALYEARAEAERLNASMGGSPGGSVPKSFPSTPELDTRDWDVYRSDTGAVAVFRTTSPIKGWTKIGSVSAEDYNHPEVRAAYNKWGQHIGKRLDYSSSFGLGPKSTHITGFSWSPERGCAIRFESGGWANLTDFDLYKLAD